MRLQFKCPMCNKEAQEVDELLGIITLSCGHVTAAPELGVSSYVEDIYAAVQSDQGEKLRHYQIEGCKFFDQSPRSLFIWDMRLGKMIAACAWLTIHKSEAFPCVIVAKGATLLQWEEKLLSWSRRNVDFQPMILKSGKDVVTPYFNIFLISYDLVPKLVDELVDLNPKLVILDECQAIKNHNAKRTQGVRKLCAAAPGVLATSGTPITNSMIEYFPILNILNPLMFPDLRRFVTMWTTTTWDKNTGRARPGSLSRHMEARWQDITKKFILRFKREEVAPELPKINRQFQVVEVSKSVWEEYAQVQKKFKEKMDEFGGKPSGAQWTDILSFIGIMRHIVGREKGRQVIEDVREFLDCYKTNSKKLVIFVHHQDIGEQLFRGLRLGLLMDDEYNGIEVERISAADTPESRWEKVKRFNSDPILRILVARTLAEGEGLNFPSDAQYIILEREWNAAKEEQAEARGLGETGKVDSVDVVYPVAVGTIDEFMAELVELKRVGVKSVLDGVSVETYQGKETDEETSLMKLTASALYEGRKTRFSLRKAVAQADSLIGKL